MNGGPRAGERHAGDRPRGRLSQIRLRVGIAVLFVAVVVPLMAGMVGYLYYNNSSLALQAASDAMERATRDVTAEVENLLTPVMRVVDAAAVLVNVDRAGLRRVEGLRFLFEQLDGIPQAYSAFVGFRGDGAFFQAVRLPDGLTAFGPSGQKPPPLSRYALRIQDASSGAMADSYIYLAGWDDVTGVDRGPVTFDPRTRPWYEGAWREKGAVISDVYLFASTGKPGLTVSRRATTEAGLEIGAVGVDITLDMLARFLDQKKIGAFGRVFILDAEGRLVCHPQSTLASGMSRAGGSMPLAREGGDPVVADAVARWQAGASNRFVARLGAEKRDYLVSFTPFPERLRKKWFVGILAQEHEFVAPLRAASVKILIVGLLVTLVSVLAIGWLSRLLTRPIRRIINETARIREFDLEERPPIRSRITEVSQLAEAVETMRTSLHSFGAYVPKSLVRTIVSSGRTISIGGERRALTVMFTDIAGFTGRSENLAPEAVLTALSIYFEAMSEAIHRYHGTIDKFIGDAVMALWNAPLDDPNHAANACRAALACQAATRALAARPGVESLLPLDTRFGLHSGEIVVGNVGAEDRMQYTAIGAAVNLASRIESVNKIYGSTILVTEVVEAAARERFLLRFIDRVAPAGTSTGIGLYELLGELEPHSPLAPRADMLAACAEWAACVRAYERRDWKLAAEGFQDFLASHPRDVTASLYVTRCRSYVADPPPPDWDGVQRYEHK